MPDEIEEPKTEVTEIIAVPEPEEKKTDESTTPQPEPGPDSIAGISTRLDSLALDIESRFESITTRIDEQTRKIESLAHVQPDDKEQSNENPGPENPAPKKRKGGLHLRGWHRD